MTVPANSDDVVRNPSSGCYWPLVQVSVFVNKGTGKYTGIHFANLAWCREEASDGSNWYSGWFAPHNEPGTFYHLDALDAIKMNDITHHVEMAAERHYTEADLIDMGVTNQYVGRASRVKV